MNNARIVMEQSPTAQFWADGGGVLREVNPAFLEFFGLDDASPLVGRSLCDECLEPEICRAAFERACRSGLVENVELHLRGRTALLSLRFITAPSNGIAGSLRDVTDWKAKLDALHESDAYFRTMAMTMTEGALLIRADGKYLATNPSAERILNLTHEDAMQRSIGKTETIREDGTPFPLDEYPATIALRDGKRAENVVLGVRRSDKSVTWIRANATPLFRPGSATPYAATVTFSDFTAERGLEAQLLQSQKLESLGQLAGGVAHDFNNMLTVIFNRCDLLKRRLQTDPTLLGYVSDIARAAQQSADITQQLLAAGRKQVMQPKVVDPAAVIEDFAGLLVRTIGEHISVQMRIAGDLWRVFADPSKLRQVLLNLVVNARDAMPGGGTLTIEARNFVADAAYVARHPRVAHGEYVVIAVSDTGSGIPSAILDRIYDPFFTTKPVGKGSGLGLAVVRGLVEQAGGHVYVYSEVEHGTTFKLYFPRFEGDVENLMEAAASETPLQGSETILLVEDEELVRMVIRETLEASGYIVIDAPSPEQALNVDANAIDLLLTDITMPGLSGPEVAEKLRAVKPALRVLFMSGYTDDAIAQHGFIDRDAQFIEKPVTPDKLLTRIRGILDS